MDPFSSSPTLLIAGGGIGGLTAALACLDAGTEVTVLEQAPALAPVGAGIALWPNATRVLARLGLLDAIIAAGCVVERVHIRAADGRVLSETTAPGAFEVPGVCIHRAALHDALRQALPDGVLRLGQRIERYEIAGGQVTVHTRGGQSFHADALIGADGLHSAVRAQLLGAAPPVYRGYAVWRGVADFEGGFYPDGLATETWGPGSRFGVFRLDARRVYWYATANTPEGQPAMPGEKDRLLRRFARWHAPIPDVLAATSPAAILRHDTYDRLPVRRWTDGPVALLGDAAHPMTPNLGQGACMAIEDAGALRAALVAFETPVQALQSYAHQRVGRTGAVVKQSLQMGRLGQWTHPVAVAVRTALMRATPDRLGDWTQRRLFAHDAWPAAAVIA